MKQNTTPILLAVTFLFLLGLAMPAAAQIGGPKVGGFSEVAVDDAEVVAAADFAVEKRAKDANLDISLLEIGKAERQVVAGMNFRLCMKVTLRASGSNEADEVTWVQAVVYKNLQRVYKLSSWTTSDCGGDE